MTREEAIKTLKENYCAMCAYGSQDMESCDIRSCDNKDAIKALEQESTTKNDLGVDCISRQEVIDLMMQKWGENFSGDDAMQESIDAIREMPSVTPQEPRCKECKWWKDSDGAYRRGIGAESKCPMNRIEVYEGNGYCYLFEPQESEVEDGNDN